MRFKVDEREGRWVAVVEGSEDGEERSSRVSTQQGEFQSGARELGGGIRFMPAVVTASRMKSRVAW